MKATSTSWAPAVPGAAAVLALWEVSDAITDKLRGDNFQVLWEKENAHSGSVHALAITPDGVHVISGSDNGIVKCWAVKGNDKDRKPVWEAEESAEVNALVGLYSVQALAITPDGKYVISGIFNGDINCWALTGVEGDPSSTEKRSPVQLIKKAHSTSVNALAITGNKVISGSGSPVDPSDNSVKCWNILEY